MAVPSVATWHASPVKMPSFAQASEGNFLSASERKLVLGGLEPPERHSESTAAAGGSESEKTQASSIASLNQGNHSPELAKLVAAWPNLRPELQAAILAIIESAKGGTEK